MMPRLLLSSVLCAALVAPAFAHPVSTPPPPGPNDPLFGCRKHTGPVAVTFKPETDLKDLITWVMGFTCKNFLLDPRIFSTGKKVTVVAPSTMSAGDAYNLFRAALTAMGLDVVPKGNVLRIVEPAVAVLRRQTVPAVWRGIPRQSPLRTFVLTATQADPSAPMTFDVSIR